ncbi:MAG: MFS transporter [Planctomycetota bacterium]|nr:MFS transporter [Planctomycetota bacterium]MDG2144269.1 MFS transporter [Planctomycetota bacterium]
MDTNSQAADSGKRSILGLVFLTVFLDIVGFSIIFPLFPDLLDHYLALSGEGSFLANLVAKLEEISGGEKTAVVTLFGGLLGSVYGLLQFLFATVWGGLSDRIGRRPTLLVTLVGTALSYVLWIFAGSFAVLIAARVLGGIMAGNISTASAAVADTTTAADRAKGMGIVGMAIGLGFILGPAIGGLTMGLELFDVDTATGSMFALNPFSVPAFFSLILALLNLLWVATKFQETLPKSTKAKTESSRSLNPFGRLKTLNFPGVVRINFIYLLYLIAFAAIEFTLTFLAKERFDYKPMDMAKMFIFVGFIIALVQGGFVRRLAPKYGERLVARIGMLCTVPGFLLIGGADTTGILYAGLAFMAVGSALVMPCLSALVSRYTPPDRQGLALGAFRSMGSLSRAAGPILGALVYWKFDSESAYRAGALLLLVPIFLAFGLPAVQKEEPTEAE